MNIANQFFIFELVKYQILIWTTIWKFDTKFVQNGYLRSKTEKMNITIKFWIRKFVLVPKINLTEQFWFSGRNLPKKTISGQKWEK